MIPRFCIQKSIRDKEATPCPIAQLKQIMVSADIQNIIDQIKLLDGKDKDELQQLKQQLPVIFPHAQSFTNNERKNQNAVPSGLAMLDIDDVESPTDLAQSVDELTLRDNQIYLVAITPSGHGLRVIGERLTDESIAAAQQRMAQIFGITSYDTCTKDLARASFVMPLSYVIYMNEAGLEFTSQEQASHIANSFGHLDASPLQQPEQQNPIPTQTLTSIPKLYKGTPYSEIISQLIGLLGGEPEIGERNTFYFTLVRYARYICDFNKELLLALLPDFGLSNQERTSIILSAINRPRKSDIPDIIQRAISSAKVIINADETHSTNITTPPPLPKLPYVLNIICRRLPEQFRPAMVIASLPVLGALATRVRFDYLDHQEHSFSFMSCITAPCATGKSFIRRPINLLLTPIDIQDEEEREKEQEYKEALRIAKNSKQQPENPRACPRNNGVNISIAKLLQLLSYSEGKHLIGIGEEIDTLVKSERAGVWSQKSDIYRLGFDNAKYGQNYMSENSFSANVPVFYNLLLTGTPGGMYRFFKDVEDGLVTRFCFAQLPDMFGTDIPDFQNYTKFEESEIVRMANILDVADGKIYAPIVDERISAWLKAKKELAIQNDSRAIDTLRKRAAVIGFRAGYLAALLNGTYFVSHTKRGKVSDKFIKKEQEAADFAEWVAEYVFFNQMQLFGNQFEQVANQQLKSLQNKGCVKNLLLSLPETFTRADLMALRAKNGQSTEVRYVLSRWIDAGYITKIDTSTFKKRI